MREHISRKEKAELLIQKMKEATWIDLAGDSTVSLNMWGFSASILKELKERFSVFLDKNLKENPLKCEYFLPFVVDELLREGKASVRVLKSLDKWYGVTYKEDKPMVMDAIQQLKDAGQYPQQFFFLSEQYSLRHQTARTHSDICGPARWCAIRPGLSLMISCS